MKLAEKPVIDGIIYVTQEELRDYVYDPYKAELQVKSGMSQEAIEQQRQDMMAGRRDVTFRNLLVRVGDER